MKIEHQTLRDRVRVALLDRIAALDPSDTQNLNEAELARELGVSRTPLREGLLLLAGAGMIDTETNRGFFVRPLNAAKVREIYPILGWLESFAVQCAGERTPAAIEELRALNDRMVANGLRPFERHAIDSAWHVVLVRRCGNRTVIRLIRQLRVQARRIDGAYARGLADREGSHAQHEAITDALEARELDRARDLVQAHWRAGESVVLKWIESHEGKDGDAPESSA